MEFLKSLLRSAWIWQPLGPPKFPALLKIQNLMTKLLQKLVMFFFKFQNSTSWQSWHSSAHACTSSWLTNAVRDAPVASVKVVVSASCLRGKRPSASSKLLRYLKSQPMGYFLHPPVFSKHDSKSNPRVKSYTARYNSYLRCEKTKQHTEKKENTFI